MRYTCLVIASFADKETESLFLTRRSRKFPAEIVRRAYRKLDYIHVATSIQDLATPPSNRLHELKGNRTGQYSISVNDQWRICFRFIDGDAYDVELTDYH